ncbi:rRNA-processing protein fcf2-like isoform X2 [Spinacia oleracea]|uniref:rRNA-processing protein fcf2-like isoform X2 n=1 Tax=Spinacia oleracea TaxID=3562 RepID=A0A9R0JCI0_SPIOL|nr:rRNA-processing protein fcf2-like isoform X2 [Spinacia oleracea]
MALIFLGFIFLILFPQSHDPQSRTQSKDLQLWRHQETQADLLRNVMDPQRHYKKGDSKSKTLPKYFQVGTVVKSASDYFSSRLNKKERKSRIADEVLADGSLAQYRFQY